MTCELVITLILSRKLYILDRTWSWMYKIVIPSPKTVKLQVCNLTSVSFRPHFVQLRADFQCPSRLEHCVIFFGYAAPLCLFIWTTKCCRQLDPLTNCMSVWDPGQIPKIRGCPGDSRTVGTYELKLEECSPFCMQPCYCDYLCRTSCHVLIYVHSTLLCVSCTFQTISYIVLVVDVSSSFQ